MRKDVSEDSAAFMFYTFEYGSRHCHCFFTIVVLLSIARVDFGSGSVSLPVKRVSRTKKIMRKTFNEASTKQENNDNGENVDEKM